jgi:topoisomerase-4 subunit A
MRMAKKEIVDKSVLHDTKIEDIFADAFGRYAKYIIQDRALPDIRDGLKPVQRRIIYAMNDLQILHDKPHKKSARSVGEVIGKYHPHGDTSIYDAMVRMSQSWKNNIPLIDMHGNNGSLDNDPAAAMRYTESRLSLYAELLIKNIRKETVPFIENFDGSEIEPTVLPSLLPNLLINGANGIAAGYATNIPPFNVVELLECLIARIDSPNSRLETILNIMPGPDFPTGGIILNKEGIREAYETGRGKINIRSKIELRTKKQAYITEIPYEVNKAELIDEINEQAEKYDILNINECHDETDQNGVSICINLYNSDNFDFVKNFLYKNTSLQIAYNFNMIAINNRKPCLMGILPYLDAFIKHCDTITLNATNFDLNKAISRKEIVTGLIKAIKVVDQVIDLIRKSNDKQNAKQELMNKMKFTEIQAESIVNLRLYRLSSSDVSELEEELKQLNALIDEFTKIVKDKKYRDNHIKGIFREYKKLFKDNKRKSSFSDEEVNISIDVSETIEDKEIYMIVTRDGYLKNVSIKSFENNEYNDIGLKEGDVQITQFKTNQKNKIIIVTNKGRYVCISIHKIEQTK